jgi:hypothetical protein
MGVFDFLNPKKKKPTDGNDLEAVLNPAASEKPKNFLSQFLPEDDTKKQALAQALLGMGAGMMASGGPSATPQNFLSVLGQGVGSGVVGYNKSLENSADTSNARTASNANNAKMQQAQAGVQFASSIGAPRGEAGYSVEQLQKIFEHQVQTGDEAGARDTLGMIQQLQQTGAKNGMVLGEDGFALAPGYDQSLFDTKKAESLGTAVGQNSQMTADQKNFEYGNANPAFRANELQLKQAGVAQPDNKFFGKSAEKAAERFAGYQEQGLKSSELTNNVGRMAELSKTIGTGKWAEVRKTVGPWAQAVGVDVEGLDDIQAFEAMVSAVAPQMRVPGSGATSDFDANQFLKSLPSMANTPEGNALIARTTTAIEQNKIRAAEISNRVYDPEDPLYGKWADAEKEINALPDPFTEFRKARGGSNASPDSTGSVQSETSAATVVGSEADYENLPAGSTYRFAGDPPGTKRTKS